MARASLLVLLAAGGLACDAPPAQTDANVPVHVGVVAVDENDLPVVILEEDDGLRWLPIWIGTAEARSIALAMNQHSPPRPNTHDLAKQLIFGLAGELNRVVVTELRNGTYFATIVLNSNGGTIDVDARPSDAIAIALRADAPIFVRSSLLDRTRREPASVEPKRQI